MEEYVSATSQNLLQESLTPGTTRKRHQTPDPSDIFSSLQQKFQRMAESKQQQCQQNQVRPLRCEFDLYMDDKNIPGLQYSSLEWWKENANKYPLLAKIAREFLCIPPTSAPSERLFLKNFNISTFFIYFCNVCKGLFRILNTISNF